MQFKSFMEALKGKQHKIDKNKNGEIDAHDFKLLRKEESELNEVSDEAKGLANDIASKHKNMKVSVERGNVMIHHKDDDEKIDRLTLSHTGNNRFHLHRTGSSSEDESHRNLTADEVHKHAARHIGGLHESEHRVARADYKTGPSGRKSHKEIIFKDAESKDDEDEKEEMKEAKMSDADMAERERIVKGMKKNLTGFKARYGDRAKEVMYATATKQAMKEEEQLDEISKATLGSYIKKASEQGKKAAVSAGISNKALGSAMASGNKQLTRAHDDNIISSQNLENKRKAGVAKAVDKLTKEEAVQKADIPAYLRKQQGQTPLKLSDLKRKDTISDKENLAKLRNEKAEELDEKSDQAKRNKMMKNMMDASRGARHKLNNPVPDAEPEHKTARAQNVAIGRALRSEEKKDDLPFDGPYTKTKPVKNSDGTTQSPMSRARQLAKDAMKKQMKEDIDRLFEKDDTEYDYEGEMAVTQLKTIIRHAEALQAKMQPNTNLPEWVQSKITLATDYIQTASDYLHSELEEQAHVEIKEHFDSDGNIINSKVSYKEFAMMLEYEAKDGRYTHKGSYGGSYVDPEGADDADDKKPKQQPAEKRGRGRPAGAKSGAGKITGTSKLYK